MNSYAHQAMTAIKRCRTASGLSQEDFARELARRLGRRVGYSTVHRWETGRHVPPADVLLAAADISQQPYQAAFGGGPVEVISPRERLAMRLIRVVEQDIEDSVQRSSEVSAEERDAILRELRRWSPVAGSNPES